MSGISLGSATVSLGIDSSALSSGVNAAKGVLSSLASGDVGGAIAGGLAAAGVAAIGFGVASVAAAGNFQAGMTSLVTGAGEAKNNLAMVSQGILAMSVATGTSTQQLTSGMFEIESSGVHGAAGLAVLQSAAEGAKVGNADLGVTANALTTVLTDYHMATTTAAQATVSSTVAMNGLTATVAAGKTHLQDVASAMGNILPLASKLGVSFPQVGGALATMTNAGMSAQRASMNLGNALRSLSAPGSTAQKAMQEVGLTSQQVSDTLKEKGLTGALQLVEEHVGSKFPAGSVQGVAAMKAIMGGATGLNVELMLGGKNMKSFEGNVTSISSAMAKGKGSVTGWSDVQQDFNFKMDQAKNAVSALMIGIGTQLLPVVTQIVGATVPVIGSFINMGLAFSGFVGWMEKGSAPAHALGIALLAVGSAIAVIKIGNMVADIIAAIPAMLTWIGTTYAQVTAEIALAIAEMAANWPIYLIIAAVVAVIAIVVLLVQHWSQVSAFLTTVWHGIASVATTVWNAIASFFVGIWNKIVSFIVGVWTNIVDFVKAHAMLLLAVITGPIGAIVILIVTHWTQIKDFISTIWNDIITFITTAVSTIISTVSGWVNGVVGWVVGLHNLVINWITMMVVAAIVRFESIRAQAIQKVTDLVNGVVGWFINLHTQAVAKVQQLEDGIKTIFENMANTAITWGENIINGIVQGIKNVGGNIGGAITGAIGNVSGALHNAHIPGFAGGVQNFTGGWAVVGEHGPELLNLPQGSNVVPQTSPSSYGNAVPQTPPSVYGASNGGSGGSSSQQPIVNNYFTVTLDGQELAGVMVNPVMENVSYRIRSNQSGGRAA